MKAQISPPAVARTALLVEFDPEIRLGELLCKLGPQYKAKATVNGRVLIVPTAPNQTARQRRIP